VDSWRWAGVPVFIRTGKRLATTANEVFVTLKHPPHELFDDVKASAANHLRFRLSPDVVLELGARAKKSGGGLTGEAVHLDAFHQHGDEVPAYQRLLADAMRGDQMLFARTDAVEASWRVVEPALEKPGPLYTYKPGTFGPAEADAIIGGPWHDPT